MEMIVWQLRREGVKLPKEQLDGPHRGWLRLEQLNIAGEQCLHAALHAGQSRGAPALVQSLARAEVRKMNNAAC